MHRKRRPAEGCTLLGDLLESNAALIFSFKWSSSCKFRLLLVPDASPPSACSPSPSSWFSDWSKESAIAWFDKATRAINRQSERNLHPRVLTISIRNQSQQINQIKLPRTLHLHKMHHQIEQNKVMKTSKNWQNKDFKPLMVNSEQEVCKGTRQHKAISWISICEGMHTKNPTLTWRLGECSKQSSI